MGIYRITNLVNGKIYIGGSRSLQAIFNRVKFQLKNGLHVNKELQKDYLQWGEEKFSFEVADYLEPRAEPDYDYTEDLRALEEMWLEKLEPYGEKGYNQRKAIAAQPR